MENLKPPKMKVSSLCLLALVVGSVVLVGCNDQVVPDQRIVDQMNSQRKQQTGAMKQGSTPGAGMNPYGNAPAATAGK